MLAPADGSEGARKRAQPLRRRLPPDVRRTARAQPGPSTLKDAPETLQVEPSNEPLPESSPGPSHASGAGMPSILQASRDTRALDRLELEARARARTLVTEAEAEAARILAVAEHERAEALEAAAAAGRQQGLASAAATLFEAVAARERRLAEVEREIAEVALEVARAIVGKTVSERPELVLDMARRALDPVRRRREILVRVNPSDGPCLRAGQEHLRALLDRAPGIVVKEDAQVDPGGVVVETEAGCVDARVETQLAILERALAEQVP